MIQVGEWKPVDRFPILCSEVSCTECHTVGRALVSNYDLAKVGKAKEQELKDSILELTLTKMLQEGCTHTQS